jgi:hypothetical protein
MQTGSLKMARNKADIELDLDVMHETPDAYKVTDGEHECWLPKSEVQQLSDGVFALPVWLAYEHGFI